MNIQALIEVMADKAIALGETTGSDDTGIVRAIVTANGLSFNAWLCVCCEIADRNAQAEGYKNQADRAGQRMAKKFNLGQSDKPAHYSLVLP
jgi:hypothetical protein